MPWARVQPRRPTRARADRAALRAAGLIVALAVAPAGARAADESDAIDLVNFAYTADSGFGGYSLSGRSVQVYRIPFSYTLRSLQEHARGIRLTLPVSFGFHNLKAVVEDEVLPLDRLRTVTFVPGLEIQLPMGSQTVLKPFVEGGFGRETEGSGATVYLYSAGVKSLTTRRLEGVTVGVGTNVEWNGVSAERGGSDDFGAIEMGVEALFPLRAALAGRRLDLGPYVILRYFYSDVVFDRIGAPAIEIDGQVELGASLGTREELRVLGVKLPRLGLAYRFGDGIEAWRINFGFPF